MVGKKSGKALLREEGLERTDNNLNLTSWPVVAQINQKNYYTDYLKRDDQALVLRLQQEEARNQMTKLAKDKDRALAKASRSELPLPLPTADVDMQDQDADEGGDVQEDNEPEIAGSKVIVVHPGSQNLRIGFASDALPKTIPMVVARKWRQSESEENAGEPKPKRQKSNGDGSAMDPEKLFGEEFAAQYAAMSLQLKKTMRENKRRLLPNSKELVVNYNRRTVPEQIPEHNDPMRVEWTEIPADPQKAPDYFTGHAAMRVPDNSNPRYKLFWPLQSGVYNEHDYAAKSLLFEDIAVIIENAIIHELGLKRRKSWSQYSCVLIIPDLYERLYVTNTLEMLLHQFGFGRVCFIQESLAATFGSGYSNSCIVDIGAQKTSICCVEEGMCLENSRINLKYGGADVTEMFLKMMLFDHFPYEEINLMRRYDFLLAEELKQKFCTMNEADISVQLYDFHLRAAGQDTRKYTFKTYDEVLLAPLAYFQPTIFDNGIKLRRRRRLVDRSYDVYDGDPNDPVSAAQLAIYEAITTAAPGEDPSAANGSTAQMTTRHQQTNHNQTQPYNLLNRIVHEETTPRSSTAPSPVPDASNGTPVPPTNGGATPPPGSAPNPTNPNPAPNPHEAKHALAAHNDSLLPIYPLDLAILTSISHAVPELEIASERKTRDFLGGIMLIGGGSLIPGLHSVIEERIRAKRPQYTKEIIVGGPPRELDATVVAWKGGSVFGKLEGTQECWVGSMEYDRLGGRVLGYKCLWAW